MARLARVVAPGYPHHVTQRGNRRQQTFFTDDDYRVYRSLIAQHCVACETEVWAYCLMPNHVHLVVVPSHLDGLRCAIAEAHRRYTRRVNQREGWQGHLWQERYNSFVMDEPHLIAAVRYIENNPVRAGLCERAEDWPFSSAKAHLAGEDDALVTVAPMRDLVPDWRSYLLQPHDAPTIDALHAHSRTGRPLGSEGFVEGLETQLRRPLRRKKPGPKQKSKFREA